LVSIRLNGWIRGRIDGWALRLGVTALSDEMHIRWLLFGFGFALMGVSAWAAEPAPGPVLVRGTITRIDEQSVTVRKADGSVVTAALAPEAQFSTVEARQFEQIKATDFVGVTSAPGPNDTIVAEEIHVIPQKGFHEGSYPWDHHPDRAKPGSSGGVTNGTVAAVHDDRPATYTMTNANVTASSGMQLTVSYQGSKTVGGKCVGHAPKPSPHAAKVKPPKSCTGTAVIEVEPWTPIMAIVPGKPRDAKVGLAVVAAVQSDAQAKLLALSLIVEKNGLKPQF
jgi:hypothetical protein